MTWSRRAAWTVISTLTLLLGTACNDTTPPPEPISFARANRVAFVCADLTKPVGDPFALVEMKWCYPYPNGAENGYGTYALVLQSSRGEVAAVDVRNWRVIDNRNDIPGKTFVPTGEIPVAVATAPDHPQMIYVANGASRDITVLRTLSTMSQKPDQPALLQRFKLKLPDADAPDEPFDMVMSPDQDAVFVTSRAGGWLVRIPINRCPGAPAADGGVASDATPDRGTRGMELAARDDCEGSGLLDEANMLRIPIDQSWSKLPAEVFQQDAAASGDEPYRYTCDQNPPLLSISATPPQLPAQDTDVGTPEPTGMAVDAFCEAGSCTRRLLVADAHQPIVHAIDLDKLTPDAQPADAVLQPILTGAPTERLAVTPRVPVDLTGDAETQYVYAIDVRDGTVIVTQDGRVKNVGVNPAVRADRLDLGPTNATATIVAMSLEVVTPNYRLPKHYDEDPEPATWVTKVDNPVVDNDPLQCVDNNHQQRLSERLRGVYLAVGATDGTVRFINVHDMELRECRNCTRGDTPSYQPFNAGYDPLPVVRNNPRMLTYQATDLTAVPVLAPSVVPQFVINGAVIGVKSDGTTNDTRVAGLDCIACSGEQAVSFPTDETVSGGVTTTADGGVLDNGEDGNCSSGQGRICSVADPYVEPRNWQAIYEGPIPGTLGGRGRFLPKSSSDNKSGALEFVGDTTFCDVGVLGDDAIDTGDQIVITSPLPSDDLRTDLAQPLDQGERDLCNKLVAARDAGDQQIAFGIRRAFNDRVQVTPELILPRAASATWDQVWKCFAGLPLTYQVRSRESFVVRDLAELGFRHRVIAKPDTGSCVIDETQDPQRMGRVRRGERFDNGLIAFQPSDGNFAPLTVLNLGSISNAPKLYLSIADATGTTGWQGVMPQDMRYSPVDQQLYIVDPTVRGLLQISLNPVSSVVSADRTIQ